MLFIPFMNYWFSKGSLSLDCIEEGSLMAGSMDEENALLPLDRGFPYHVPVMVEETLDLLMQTRRRFVVDGTAGEGGHTLEMAHHLAEDGTVLAVDRDPHVLPLLRRRLQGIDHAMVMRGLFQDIPDLIRSLGLPGPDFVLLDLGLSSFQLADRERGFSFLGDGPCDMRMSCDGECTAASVVNGMNSSQLADLLYELGGERKSRKIAEVIVRERGIEPLRTTHQLVRAILRAYGGKRGRIHPATRTFQALRIYVNGEMDALRKALQVLPFLLSEGGILSVMSYHSLEDAEVKAAFLELEDEGFEVCTHKPIRPKPEEIRQNRRSRSAKLRAIRRRVS